MSTLVSRAPRYLRRRLTKLRIRAYDAIRDVDPQFGFRSEDVLIASFPKSGRNWVRFLLANSMVEVAGANAEITFHNSSEWVSTTFPREPPVDGYPRMVATHDEHAGQDTRVIYLLRHPADVMESYYDYLQGRWNMELGEFSEFVRTDEYGIPAWREHVESWEEQRTLVVAFEDLKEDPKRELEQMYELFERDPPERVFENAVERSSFENMKRIEEEYGIPPKLGANPNYTFMRKGESDQGEEYFDEEDYRYLQREAGDLLERYDYAVPIEQLAD